MPSSFASEFAAGAFPELVAEFGEVTTYYKADGSTREIDAIVVTSPAQLQGAEGAPVVRCVVRVLNSATRGILASEMTLGRDAIDVALREGAAVEKVTIQQLVSDNGGVTSVACT